MQLFGSKPAIFISIENLTVNVEINPRPEPPTDIDEEMEDLQDEVHDMNTAFNRLSLAVAAMASVEAGVKTTIQHLADQVRALGDAPTEGQINALADNLESTKDQIAADIVAGTPAEGETPTEPVVVPVTDPADVDQGAGGTQVEED